MTTSVSSSWLISPTREPRSSTERWPSKCGVVKYGVDASATIASFSSALGPRRRSRPVSRSPVSGSTRVGARVAEEDEGLPADLVDAAVEAGDARESAREVVDVLHTCAARPAHAAIVGQSVSAFSMSAAIFSGAVVEP